VTVVVSYVPTQEGRSALRAAADEALRRRTPLVLVQPDRASGSVDEQEARALETVRASAVSDLDAAGLSHEVRYVTVSNDPAGDLLSIAETVGAELIVIGLRRRTPVGKLVLGLSAQRILLDAPCAVLAVKAPRPL